MFLDKDVTLSNFFVRLKNWEYWPFGIVQFPAILYFIWLSIRARSFLFFSASNPGITMGGMFGESKYDVLKLIPERYKPLTAFVKAHTPTSDIINTIRDHSLKLPVIFKPDLGERGFMVKRINTDSEITTYCAQLKHSFLIQELIDLPLEFGVFYLRYPDQTKGKVTSIVMKEMLAVTGDGLSTLEHLIYNHERARLQWHKLKKHYASEWREVVPQGQNLELVSIGNHCLGTKFLDGGHLINEKLSETFDEISRNIDGFYFGRFDLRCASLEDLYRGNIKVLELNGCGAEPAHIYQPGYSLFKAMGVLLKHWQNIFLVARANVQRGTTYISLKDARKHYKKFRAATQGE